MRIPVLATGVLLLASTLAAAQAATAPASSASVGLPPTEKQAATALTASPRHGEWQDIALPDGTKLHTWVVYPERRDNAPVVLVIHEIFGLTDWVRGVADQLAAEGFIAVAPDMLSGKGPDGGNTDSFASGDVRAAISKVTADEVAVRLDAAKNYATKLPAATAKFAVVGYCWGGSQSWNYAVRQPDLAAAVVYYGTAPKDTAELTKIKTPVLGLYGGDDARVTSTVEPTKAAMAGADKTYETHVYDGAGHGFLKQLDGRDGANLKAAQSAWPATLAFLREHLQK